MTIRSRLVPQFAHDAYQKYKWYLRHPWARIAVACSLMGLNFGMYAEDPVAHSHAEALIPVVGNAYALVFTQYPGGGLSVIKHLMWIGAILFGMGFGRNVIHHRLLRDHFGISMFGGGSAKANPKAYNCGTWMIMFFTTIVTLAITSYIWNIVVLVADPDDRDDYIIDGGMDMQNRTFMMAAAVGTWMGDSVTAFMVIDMILQDTSRYPEWHPTWREYWKNGWNGKFRVVFFWVVLVGLSTLVISGITGGLGLDWDDSGEGFDGSTELGRAYLAGFITVLDLMVVIQDWDFPTFDGDLDIKMPGLPWDEINFSMPAFINDLEMKALAPLTGTQRPIKVYISGKWFNYGIIFCVMCLDFNMLKNQVIYLPYDFGQCVSYAVGPYGETHEIFSPTDVAFIESDAFVDGLDCSNATFDDVTIGSEVIEGHISRSRFIDAGFSELFMAIAPTLFFLWLFVKAAKGQADEHKEGKTEDQVTSVEIADTKPLTTADGSVQASAVP